MVSKNLTIPEGELEPNRRNTENLEIVQRKTMMHRMEKCMHEARFKEHMHLIGKVINNGHERNMNIRKVKVLYLSSKLVKIIKCYLK